MKSTVLLMISFLSFMVLAQDTGTIDGTVYDKTTGETLISASVRLEGTEQVVFADVNGAFSLKNVAVGTHSVTASFTGFSTVTVENVEVKSGEKTTINFELDLEGVQQTLVVTAEALQNSEIGMLKHRQKSTSIADGISVEEIKRSGGSTAADAVTKITGASVVGGKYIYIRGLGDRYTSTHLNGVEMPTSDPDVKAFQADLFPTNALDNIVTLKSFTPDKPGNFSGGIIDIGTRNYPGQFTFTFSGSSSYNTQTTFNDDFILYPGSSTDWQGRDNGMRALPDSVVNADIPTLTSSRNNDENAAVLDGVSKAFEPIMAPESQNANLNGGFNLSLGNTTELFGNKLGFLATLSYNRKYEFIDDRRSARWKLTENPDAASSLVNQSDLRGAQGKDKVNWGSLLTLSYTLASNHELSANVIYTQGGESSALSYAGQWPEQFSSDNAFLESRVMKYTERNLTSFQVRGKHYFESLWGMDLDWTASTSESSQDEPDTRIFTNNYSIRNIGGEPGRVYSITPSVYSNPARYFRNLNEESSSFKADFTVPFRQWGGRSAQFKFGGAFESKERAFIETRYEYASESNIRYDGDPSTFFAHDNSGILYYDEVRRRYVYGNVIQLSPDARGGNYDGDQDITSYYAMVDLPLSDSFKAVVGARMESAEMNVFNADVAGSLDDDDLLPSLNLIYAVSDQQNVRFSYGRTLARPNFREKAPYASFDVIAEGLFAGNPDLKRTLIDNLDLRWEFYPRGGELIAASVFHKDFENPIERSFNIRFASEFGEQTYTNVDKATVQGLELEFRKQFDWLVNQGKAHLWSVNANISFIDSEVDIPSEELAFLLLRDPNADPTRQLQGQSPYLVNFGVNYDNHEWKTAASINYNVFGERLDEVGIGGAPDSLEQSREMLDFTFSKYLFRSLTLNLSAKNLLDSPIEIVQSFKGQDFVKTFYRTGRTYSMSISYKPN